VSSSESEPRAGRGRLADVLATRGGQAKAEAPFVIEHREALIYMLCEAAELEHGIMCQYLFAAFTLKQSVDEGLTEEQLDVVNRWRTMILHVAAEEMLHLALVHNVLSAIGSAPHLGRPNLPAPASHYPAGVNLTLVPFGKDALRHFMFLERPEGMELEGAKGIDAPLHDAVALTSERDIVPRLQDFATVGHLYRSVEQGLARLCEKFGERNLFIGPPDAQAVGEHFRWSELRPVTDLASAQQALDTILEQGEGARGDWKDAHFGQFVEILQEYRDLRERDPGFEPARPVVFATARPCEHDDTVPLISDPVTARCVDLFNVAYEILLLTLERYFAHTEEDDRQLKTLADAAIDLMVGVLSPLGHIITSLPAGPAHPGQNAGPSFELFYESDYLMPHLAAAWTMLEERLREASAFGEEIRESAAPSLAEMLEPVAAALGGTADMLAARFPDWGAASRFAGGPTPDVSGRASAATVAEQAAGLLARANETSPSPPVLPLIVRTHALVLTTLESDASRAGSLLDGVLAPLVRASELDGGLAASGEPGEPAPASDRDGSLWQLAVAAARLSAVAGHGEAAGWLRLAAARSERLANDLPPGPEVPTRPERQAAFDSTRNAGDPTITLVQGGPLIATDVERVTDWLGTLQPPRPLRALCRCGRSSEKPDCDASCLRDGFDDRKDPKRVPDRRDTYHGEQVTIFDNRGICQHSGYCTDRLASVFHTDGDPFVTPSGGRMDEIVHAVRACPSGALSYALGRRESRAHVDHDQTRDSAIEITRDGPYRITGAVRLVAGDGTPVERAEGASDEHYALCRCGQSRNKPYCSGMHWYVDFEDPRPTPAASQTIYEAAGGMPALTRMTSLFYEKLAADDPLLAPLYATIPPSEPERLARELAWLTGAATDRPAEPGPLPPRSQDALTGEARERWVELMCLAAQQARLAAQPEVQATLRANLDLYSRADQPDTRRFTWVQRPKESTEEHEDDGVSAVTLPQAGEPIGFGQHIKALFRERDRTSMRFAFDLWSFDDVRANADAILERVKAGTMPCDGTWPGEWVELFERWTRSGMDE
jgi:CDGSH-type Zn-finger protein